MPEATLTKIYISSCPKVRTQANLAHTHLCNDRVDRSVCSSVDLEHVFSWLDTEPVEFPAVFWVLLCHIPLVLYPRADVGFRGGHQGPYCRWFRLLLPAQS